MKDNIQISVPIRGLFNLTWFLSAMYLIEIPYNFRPH